MSAWHKSKADHSAFRGKERSLPPRSATARSATDTETEKEVVPKGRKSGADHPAFRGRESPRSASDRDTEKEFVPTGRKSRADLPAFRATERFLSPRSASDRETEKEGVPTGRKSRLAFCGSVGNDGFRAEAPESGRRLSRKEEYLRKLRGETPKVSVIVPNQVATTQMQRSVHTQSERGWGSNAFDVLADAEILKFAETRVAWHIRGELQEGQNHKDERPVYEAGACPFAARPIVACQKGDKSELGHNQDNYSITSFQSGYTLVCVVDGHGLHGHVVAARCVQTMPYFLLQAWDNAGQVKEGHMDKALTHAFDSAHRECLAHAQRNQWDVNASGATAVAALWTGDKVWMAHVGDARCALGTRQEKKVEFETEDHKPYSAAERRRIERCGGEVREQSFKDGFVSHRIYVPGEAFPGLMMARSLGDQLLKDYGVIALPAVSFRHVDMSAKPFMLLASDGIWEFIETEFAVRFMAKKIEDFGPENSLLKLHREAFKRWNKEEGEGNIDDVTTVLVLLTQ